MLSLAVCVCRRAVRRGDSIRYLLQDAVVDYILEHKLYSTGPSSSSGALNDK